MTLSRKTMTAKVVDLKSRIDRKKNNVYVILKKRAPLILYLSWIVSGTVFYAFHEKFPFHIALYQSTSVGWAIGWDLPEEVFSGEGGANYGMIYSCFHNLVGVLFVGIIVMYIEFAVSKTTDNWMVEMTNRQGVEYQVPTTTFTKALKWVKLNRDRVKIYIICSGCCLLCILFGFYAIDSFSFAESCDMTLSTLSCGGYQGMPLHATKWSFVFLAIFTNVAVPLFLVAAGTLASIMMNKQDEKSFYKKIASPMSDVELKHMQHFGIENGDGVLDKKEFLILIIIRIGNVKPSDVVDIHKHFRQITRHTGGTIPRSDILLGEVFAPDRRYRSPLKSVPMILRAFRNSIGLASSSVQDDGDSSRSRSGRRAIKDAATKNNRLVLNRTVKVHKMHSFIKFSFDSTRSKTRPDNRGTMDEDENSDYEQVKEDEREEGEDEGRRLDDQGPGLRPGGNGHEKTNQSGCGESVSSRGSSPKHRWGDVIVATPPVSRNFFASPFQSGTKLSRTVPIYLGDDEIEKAPMMPKHPPMLVKEGSNNTQSSSFGAENTTPIVREVRPTAKGTPPSPTSQSVSEERVVDERPLSPSETRTRKPNPFLLARQYSRQHSTGADVADTSQTPSRLSVERGNLSSSSAPSDEPDGWGNEVREPTETSYSTAVLEPTETSYSTAGRKKFSSKKDRMTSYERTLLLLGKSREMVLGFVARSRLKRQKKMLRRSTACGLQKISEAHTALEKVQSLHNLLENDVKLCQALGLLVMDWVQDRYVQAFVLWLTWLLLGAVFYSCNMETSFYRGVYMSVNVGYAIYWTTEEDSISTKAFSVLNVILGQLVTTVAMAYFAGRLKQSWYAEAEARVKLENVIKSSNIIYCSFMKMMYFVKRNHVHFLSLLWLTFGTVWSYYAVEWTFIDSLYFSISSLSTGGMWSIPDDSPDAHYFIVAVFTCTGAPILCLSAGIFAYNLCRLSHHGDLTEAMHAPVSTEELEMMHVLDISDDHKQVDITEYVVLILIRIKAVRPELIAAVLAHFNSMEEVNNGSYSYDRMLGPERKESLSIRSVMRAVVKNISHDSQD